jgi:hypothetical protein
LNGSVSYPAPGLTPRLSFLKLTLAFPDFLARLREAFS